MQWQDFDLDGKVKIPWGYYLVLAYLMRGYLIWIVSLTYRDDRALLLSLIYPNAHTFSLNLVVGLPALLGFLLFGLKSQRSKPWFKAIWRKQQLSLSLALVVDLSIQFWSISSHLVSVHWFQIVLFLTGFYLIWYWFRSNKIKRFFSNWLVV